jgi:hypothetical protein
MVRLTLFSALFVLLLAPVTFGGCSQGGLDFNLAPVSRQDAGAQPDSNDDASTPPSSAIATLNIATNTTALEIGQRVPVELSARTDANETVEDVSAQWHVASEAVATFEDPGTLSAIAVGQTQIWASAGGVESNRLDIDVSAAGAGGTRFVLIEPRQIALAPGQTYPLHAQVRRTEGEIIEGLQVRWETSDPSIVTVDETGAITSVAAGQAQVSAVVENSEPLPVQVLVTDTPTWRRAKVVRPEGAIAARGEPVEVRVDLREASVGVPDTLGSPLKADTVVVTIDGTSVGEADIAWDVASFTLETASLTEGLHRLGARVEFEGDSYEAPPRMLWVDAPAPNFADGWENLSESGDSRWAIDDDIGPTNGNAPGLAVDSEGTVYVASEKPNRGDHAKIYVYKWNESEGRWHEMETYEGSGRRDVQLVHWSAQYEYFPHRSAQFVDLAVDDQDRLLLAFTQEAVDSGGNGDEREKRWFDVFVARYEDGYGPDGSAGWRLLTSGAQDYILAPPEAADPQHPAPADVDEHDDVFTPQVLWDTQRSRITAVWVSSPFPREKTYLDVRVWSDTDNSWTTVGERLELEGSVPELREAFFAAGSGTTGSGTTGSGTTGDGLVAVVENRVAGAIGRYQIWQMDLDSGAWTRLDTAGRLADAATLDDGSFIAANLSQGMLRGVSVRDGVQSSGDQILNRSAWVSANEPVFIHSHDGGHTAGLLWYEGALGSQQWIYGASFADSAWAPLSVDLFTQTTGEGRLVAVQDLLGRLVIARQVPLTGTDSDSPYSMLVVRSHDRLFD